MPGIAGPLTAAATAPQTGVTRTAPQRDLYIDRLRSVMTILVLLHHTAITYGAPGGWFWHELQPSGTPVGLLLTMFVATNQAYFMGFFFLLAGYFTPGSLERKGYGRFIGDRFLRLGLPLLAFGLLLGPLTAAIANAADGKGFWSAIQYLWHHKVFINGPLWFAQALLMFCLGYCIWRRWFGARLTDAARTPRAVPKPFAWLLSALLVGAVALAVRQFVPVGVNVIGLQLGYFASYIFLFAIGIAAWRYDWLRQMKWKHAQTAVIVGLLVWPLMPAGIALARALGGPGKANFAGGFTWPSILYALWEPFVAWALIAAWLLFFRSWMNSPSPFWNWMNRRAYAVYIIHPPVLVGISVLLHGWSVPALVKLAVTGSLTCIATWLLADPLVRLPGVRRVV